MNAQSAQCRWCGQLTAMPATPCELCGQVGSPSVQASTPTPVTPVVGGGTGSGTTIPGSPKKKGVFGKLIILLLLAGLAYASWYFLTGQGDGTPTVPPTPTSSVSAISTQSAVPSSTYVPPFPGVPPEATDCKNGTAVTGKSSCEFARETLAAFGAVPAAERPVGATVTLPAVTDPVRQSAFDAQCYVDKPTITCFVGPEKIYIHAG